MCSRSLGVIQSRCFVALINDIIASMISLLAIIFNNECNPNRRNLKEDFLHQNVKRLNQDFPRVNQYHIVFCHTMSNAGENAEHLLLLFPHMQSGFKQSNEYLDRCSF